MKGVVRGGVVRRSPPDFIDAHVHLFPQPLFRAIWRWFDRHGWPIRYRYSAAQVVAYLQRAGVRRAIALNYAHKPGMAEALNQWTFELAERHPLLVPFGTVHPDDKDVKGIIRKACGLFGFKGVKLHCHVQATRPDSIKMYRIYEAVTEAHGVVLVHSGTGPSLAGYAGQTAELSGARFMRRALIKFPETRFLVPHLGANEIDRFLDLMEEFPNLWMDTTFVVSQWLPIVVPWERMAGLADRILFGSDFPNIPYPYSRELHLLLRSPLAKGKKEAILHHNAARLLGLTSSP